MYVSIPKQVFGLRDCSQRTVDHVVNSCVLPPPFLSFALSIFLSFGVLDSAPALLPPRSLMLENVIQADQQLMERTKAKLFSALISALHIQGLNGKCVCVCVREREREIR